MKPASAAIDPTVVSSFTETNVEDDRLLQGPRAAIKASAELLGPVAMPGLPPVLGLATSVDGSCEFGVTRTSFLECIFGSLVPCGDGRNHQHRCVTLLAAR